MTKGRLEAFSDGVIAIIITIMVLELKVPHGAALADLRPLLPVFLSYVLSFGLVATYWNNHHHILHTAQRVSGGVLWANLFFLFCLSLTPFVTAWMGENEFASAPVALYGAVMFLAGFAYYLLSRSLIAVHGVDSTLARAVGRDLKGKMSAVLYAVSIPVAFLNRWVAFALFVIVALMWIVPDRRIEKALGEHAKS